MSATNEEQKKRKSLHIGRKCAWVLGGVVGLLLVVLSLGAWYTTTGDFQRRVGKQVVSVLEDATGGRVELGRITFNLWHLAIEADGLVIHGLEGPGEAPYLAADKILIRLKIVSFFQHTAGGLASHIGLNLLRVEQPHAHLIVDKDGKTNQPTPKHPSTSTEPFQDTVLDLKAKDVELVNGVVLLNNRAIPFDLSANDLQAKVNYITSTDRYGIVLDLNDLRTKMAKEPEAQSKVHVEAEFGRDMAALNKLELHTGKSSDLRASANITHFANPEWWAAADGTLELKQISVLSGFDGLGPGTVDLDIKGHNCNVSPATAQKKPGIFRRRKNEEINASVKTLPPDPDCKAGYLLIGSAKVHGASYQDEYVRLHDINGGAQLHITPTELLLTALTGYLPGGGSAMGELRIVNWLGEVPANTPTASPTAKAAVTTTNQTAVAMGAKAPVKLSTNIPQVQYAHAYLKATIDRIPLRTIMDVTAPKGYGDLGFDTAVSGPVEVEWGGPAAQIADSVQVQGDLKFAPTGVVRKGALNNIPVTGQTLAHYDGRTEVVNIQHILLQTPGTILNASGVLGVNLGDRLTNLQADATVRDIGEYDQLLQTLGFEANGKKGSAAIPVDLHGALVFHGTASGPIRNLDVKGHLEGDQLQVKLGTAANVQIDSLVGDADYSPRGLSVASSTIKQGAAVLHLGGSFRPRRIVSKRGVEDWVWDEGTTVDANVQLATAPILDLLKIAGQQDKIPVTGTVGIDGHLVGTFQNLSGSGHVSLANGVAYGEPYEAAHVTMSVTGQDIEASQIALQLHGMTIAGNGGYDLSSKHLHGHLEGNNLMLSKFTTVQKANLNGDGTVSLVADANGTMTEPNLKAHVSVANVTIQGKPVGELTADLHSAGSTVFYTAKSTVLGAGVTADGQTALTGDYQTTAKLTVAGFDVGKPLALFGDSSLKGSSSINGVVDVSGPAKTPLAMAGSANFENFVVKLNGYELKAAEPLRVSLKNGVALLEQVHITGQDTDLHLGGTAQVLGVTNPKGGTLNLNAKGSVSPQLAHTFDPDIIASGKVTFTVAAGGTMKSPALTGKVIFDQVNAAVDGIPNGLTNMNGTLIFNEDRLEVQSLTATTGGGQLKIGGFLTYRNGVYADLTATGDVVRVRLYGLSATANAKFRLQGGAQNALLSGTVLLTRFGIGADVDFAAFAGAGGVAAPPDPDAATNKIQLDVHVTSSPQLDFQNSYAKLAGTVDLTVRGTIAVPTVLGRIQITDGSATFAGTKYQLQRGDIYFTNPVRIDPVIDLDATARVENYDVTIGLHGTTTSLKPTYRSEPPLSEADVFNLLALGRTQEEAQLYQEQQVQAGTDPTTSALLGGALNATVSNRVEKLFGVGSVKIDPAFVGTLGTSAARITVQQQLSRQLTLTYATNVNSSAQQLIQVQYQLNPRMSVVATRDETGVFSIVYKIRQRYR
ncbi:translocation and assembly module TamB [Granulicella pectinivorans]|uniref:Translocation and assembly module TamB n=1 Tax=Granulicella pectinivorans TaxID=474950 RepID=A0A1I6M769_9BACT|nr:translocation/assembly module TamB domain-containing protein [Granulicella pectinivorans]SFS11544.1 translocation and assembly module TamB [Granulicella pectinivorans]